MNKSTLLISLFLPFFFPMHLLQAQCTPGDEESCPDPENNGQICPDSIAPVIIGLPYNQEITMLPPSEIDTLGITAELFFIKLVSIDGLPEGIDWVTNTEDNIFQAGIYYCILFSGTSNAEEGLYPIKIEVNLYVNFFGDTLEVPGLIDSTSISMAVIHDYTAIGENSAESFVSNMWPNPFRKSLNIELSQTATSPVELKIYNMLGQVVYYRTYSPGTTQGILEVDGEYLPEGMYFISLESDKKRYTQLISRSK